MTSHQKSLCMRKSALEKKIEQAQNRDRVHKKTAKKRKIILKTKLFKPPIALRMKNNRSPQQKSSQRHKNHNRIRNHITGSRTRCTREDAKN